MYRTTMLAAVAALWSSQVSAADVYVAPGGVFINSARVYVAPPPNADPAYAVPSPTYNLPPPSYGVPPPIYGVPQPTYGLPQPTFEGPAYLPPNPSYGPPPISAYGQARVSAAPPRPYVKRGPGYYARVYDEEFVPRPPAVVPYGVRQRCIVPLGPGRIEYCE